MQAFWISACIVPGKCPRTVFQGINVAARQTYAWVSAHVGQNHELRLSSLPGMLQYLHVQCRYHYKLLNILQVIEMLQLTIAQRNCYVMHDEFQG